MCAQNVARQYGLVLFSAILRRNNSNCSELGFVRGLGCVGGDGGGGGAFSIHCLVSTKEPDTHARAVNFVDFGDGNIALLDNNAF